MTRGPQSITSNHASHFTRESNVIKVYCLHRFGICRDPLRSMVVISSVPPRPSSCYTREPTFADDQMPQLRDVCNSEQRPCCGRRGVLFKCLRAARKQRLNRALQEYGRILHCLAEGFRQYSWRELKKYCRAQPFIGQGASAEWSWAKQPNWHSQRSNLGSYSAPAVWRVVGEHQRRHEIVQWQ